SDPPPTAKWSERAGVQWLQRAPEAGLPQAQYRLGYLYLEGQGVAKDPKKAASLFAAAADKGDLDAAVILGWMFENGIGVDSDWDHAAQLYAAAAEGGSRLRQIKLGDVWQSA